MTDNFRWLLANTNTGRGRMAKRSKHDTLLKRIDVFLAEIRKPQPGNESADVGGKDLSQLEYIIWSLIDIKYDCHFNGDLQPVGYVRFIDKHRHHYPHIVPVPNDVDDAEYLEAVLENASFTKADCDRAWEYLRYKRSHPSEAAND